MRILRALYESRKVWVGAISVVLTALVLKYLCPFLDIPPDQAGIIALAIVSASEAPSRDRAECGHECITCSQRCSLAPDKDACKRTCLELKRACCASAGKGPGPRLTCSCT